MNHINILPMVAVSDSWTQVVIPDRVRKSISFQLESLGVLLFSLDGGATSMKVVGTGETLQGNFSKCSVYFKIPSGDDNLQIRIQDT